MISLSVSVIIPAFNERERIGPTLDAVRGWLSAHVSTWEIRVVDDGSTDDTAAQVEATRVGEERIVLQREAHRGKGGAVRAGMLAATGDVRFLCDADLSMPIEHLERFLMMVPGQCDVAIGSRELLGAHRIGEPPYRHLMGRVFNMLVHRTGLAGIEDTQCGFKMFSARAAQLIFSQVTLDGWAFDVEALVIAQVLGLRVVEIPIEWHYRAASRVSPVRDTIRMTRDVAQIRRNRARGMYRVPPA